MNRCRIRPAPPPRRTAALAALLLLATPSPSGAADDRPEPLPAEITLTTLDGDTVSFGDLRGKAVLLDFWATWCEPCHDSLPALRRLHERIETEELPAVLVSVSVDENREALERFVEEEGMEWLQVWDREAQFSDGIGVRSYPLFLMVDHEGRPVRQIRGWSSRHDMMLSGMVLTAAKKARKAARRATESSTR